ncbi:GFA family protein [Streptomyces sp. NPDC058330]|uniref:GFA family protein n=1 Tax=Streptomyces sp. NPDC058330 TaxID=3346449 RepID=UPI0036E3FF35
MSEIDQQQTRTGGCLCGKIRYSANSRPFYPHVCSCPHCRKLSGGPMMAFVGLPLSGFAWDGPGGEPTWYATSPGAGRGFCGDCGSRVCALDDGSDAVFVTVMSLDDDGVFVPRNQHFRDDAVSWLPQVPEPTTAV